MKGGVRKISFGGMEGGRNVSYFLLAAVVDQG